MFAITLEDGAELRPLEPWQAEEFLAHLDRARAVVDPWIPWASQSADLDSARATLQRYADLAARDAGRLYGIWLDGTLVGGTMFVAFDAAAGTAEIGCWLEPAGQGRGLITRAAGHLIDWAVRVRGIHRFTGSPARTTPRAGTSPGGWVCGWTGCCARTTSTRGSGTTPRSGPCWHRSGSTAPPAA